MFGADLHAQSVPVSNKISASELRRKLIKTVRTNFGFGVNRPDAAAAASGGGVLSETPARVPVRPAPPPPPPPPPSPVRPRPGGVYRHHDGYSGYPYPGSGAQRRRHHDHYGGWYHYPPVAGGGSYRYAP